MDYKSFDEQEIEIKSSLDGIVNILENEFFDDYNELEFNNKKTITKHDVVKFCTYALIQVDNEELEDENSIYDYFADSDCEDKAKAKQIFDTDYVIVFSELKKNILMDILNFLIDFMPTFYVEGNINYIVITKNLIRILSRCIKRLKSKAHKCIFVFLVENKFANFRTQDVLSFFMQGDQRSCDHMNINCKRRSKEFCTLKNHEIEKILKDFEADGIIVKSGNGWAVVK